MVLYDYELSADAYAARLLLNLLGIAHEKRPVDVYPGGEHLRADFLALAPRGSVPVLVDGDLVLGTVAGILCHLAAVHGAPSWLPREPAAYARCMDWLAVAASDFSAAGAARLEAMLDIPSPIRDPRVRAREAFRMLESHLVRQSFGGFGYTVGDAPAVCDIALFPHVALSIDFGMDLGEFPKLRAWSRRIRALPGFIATPGIPEFL